MTLDDVPQDVERDITRALNVLAYLNLSDLRLMCVLDIIVKRWRAKMVDALGSQDISTAE